MKQHLRWSGVAAVGLGLVLSFAFGGCSHGKDPWDEVEGGQLKVLVSFPPLYCFTKAVADKDAKVQTLLANTGPHEHQASGSDAHWAIGANLFLANGLTLDDFVTKVANSSANKDLKVIKIAEKGIPDAKLIKGFEHKHEDGTVHGDKDPHTWLGIEQAILMVETIRDELSTADPAHADNYKRRAGEYIEQLKKLQDDGKKLLADKKNRKLIAMHESLAYFCKSYGLELEGSIMPKPGVEADATELGKLVEKCEKQNIQIIAVEPQYG
ncbi:MAG TPA: zinc ABC transporter substrate-binding protein, partial [Gemmataceae bacterium]|nr:zinc ABC transporter substrate-binding protein [Gemmataceae bacterium]